MATSLTLVVAPAAEPVTRTEAKTWLRVDTTYEDTLLDSLITEARLLVEEYARLALITQTWRYALDGSPTDRLTGPLWPIREGAASVGEAVIELPRPPLQSVTSVTYYSTADAATTLSTSVYRVDTNSLPGRIALKESATWPISLRNVNSFVVQYVAGYGASGSSVPAPIRRAVLLAVGALYEDRSGAVALPPAAKTLLQPYRVVQV